MITQIRLILATLFLSIILIACGDNTLQSSVENVEKGMSTNTVIELLGEPSSNQTQTIDSLTMTHSEWTDKTGTVNVQFINNKVQFFRFTAL